ncbi:tetratricopeptide repeat protein [Solirubrobacter phytolaccae]|uniref:Tetratricopeptide repeat protein n=1 Tax=Solirubrobacter phytolaccae TaxID=1404360 RepID=A0A9X3N5M9_9ACTN|nr:tetratricopeptide repeat protein [Solirubrobacter phytolaccae]MDA0178792.1 tetratricopeptide repeat protein [Solirubrobacter phytolaccae]
MNSALDIPEQLATPFAFRATGPTLFGSELPRPNNTEQNQPPSHLVEARRLVDRHPDSAIAWARLAQSAQASADIEQSLDAAGKALAMGISQLSRPAIHAAVTVLASYGRTETVFQALQSHGANSIPNDLRLWMAIETKDETCIEQIVSEAQSPTALVTRGWVAITRGRYQDAIRDLRAAQATGATGPGLLMNLGYAHAAVGNLEKAIKITRQAAALAPNDRGISLNLAGFQRALGHHEAAVDEIRRVAGARPDIELALVLADFLLEAGEAGKAHDVLQRVRTSREWAHADRTRRSELEANLAFLRWSTRRQDRTATLAVVLRALASCEHSSLAIGNLLMNLVRDPPEAPVLAAEIARLATKHPEDSLLSLRFHHAVVMRDAHAAAAYACAWAESDIFNSTAASLAIHLLTDAEGRAPEAAELGLKAIRRAPADPLLLNNTAYALCLAGRPAEAKRLIASTKTAAGQRVALRATEALADLMLGNCEQGQAGYREAQRLAREQGRPDLEALAALNMALAMRRAPGCKDEMELPTIPEQWKESPTFWMVSHRVRRELDVDSGER